MGKNFKKFSTEFANVRMFINSLQNYGSFFLREIDFKRSSCLSTLENPEGIFASFPKLGKKAYEIINGIFKSYKSPHIFMKERV